MSFCGKCGKELSGSPQFCPDCGAKVPNRVKTAQPNKDENGPSTRHQQDRRQVFDGVIHKCPNCGEIIDGYRIKCSSCGYEIRRENAIDSVEILSQKLQAIENQRKDPGKFESIATMYGLPTSSKNIYKAKASLISNYAIPNTKEDILEFMILASSNIVPSIAAGRQFANGNYFQEQEMRIEQEAWVSKMRQAYQKAVFSFKDDPDFYKIKTIYESKINEINTISKTDTKRVSAVLLVVLIPMMILLLGLPIGGIIIYNNEQKGIQKENERLEEIVEEIEDYIDEGNYEAAMRKTRMLHYDGPYSYKNEEKWDEIREEYTEEIKQLKDNEKG